MHVHSDVDDTLYNGHPGHKNRNFPIGLSLFNRNSSKFAALLKLKTLRGLCF